MLNTLDTDFRRLMQEPSDNEGTNDEVDNLLIQHSDEDSEYARSLVPDNSNDWGYL